MQIVILCGGKATRLFPLTATMAKSMIPIRGKPFLEHQLDLLKKNTIRDVVLCVGNFGEQIEEYFRDGKKFDVRVRYSYDGEHLLGTGGALKQAEPLLEKYFFVMYGDSYLPFDFRGAIKFFEQSQKQGLMVVYKNHNSIEESNVNVEGNMVKTYDKKNNIDTMEYIDYGVSIFRKDILHVVSTHAPSDLTELHTHLIAQEELLAFAADERFYQIGSFDGLEEFRRYAKDHTL